MTKVRLARENLYSGRPFFHEAMMHSSKRYVLVVATMLGLFGSACGNDDRETGATDTGVNGTDTTGSGSTTCDEPVICFSDDDCGMHTHCAARGASLCQESDCSCEGATGEWSCSETCTPGQCYDDCFGNETCPEGSLCVEEGSWMGCIPCEEPDCAACPPGTSQERVNGCIIDCSCV